MTAALLATEHPVQRLLAVERIGLPGFLLA